MKKFQPIRMLIFFVSVFALSKFFEAGRIIAEEKTFSSIGFSLFSGLVFVLSLLMMGYWVYAEEKEKGNLKHTFGLYEWFYRRRLQK